MFNIGAGGADPAADGQHGLRGRRPRLALLGEYVFNR